MVTNRNVSGLKKIMNLDKKVHCSFLWDRKKENELKTIYVDEIRVVHNPYKSFRY